MTSPLSHRLLWSALAATAMAPFALYRLLSLRPQATRLSVSLTETDLYDDLFDGEVAASAS